MIITNLAELKALLAELRAARVTHYRCGELELSLEPEAQVVQPERKGPPQIRTADAQYVMSHILNDS